MANNRIKGLVVEIGGDTTKLGKALEQTEKQTRGLTSELADVNKLLKLDPGNTDLLAQKQRILGELIGKTGDKLTALRAANEKAAKSAENYDKWLRKYQPLQEESDKLREQLRKLQQQQRKIAEEEGPDSDGYRALQPEVDAVRAALKSLQQQQKAVTDEFGDPASPEQLRALQREITKTEKQLADYADAQADAAQSASDLKTDLQQTATEVKSEGKAASDSADAHEDLGDAAHKAVDGLKVLVTAAAGAPWRASWHWPKPRGNIGLSWLSWIQLLRPPVTARKRAGRPTKPCRAYWARLIRPLRRPTTWRSS